MNPIRIQAIAFITITFFALAGLAHALWLARSNRLLAEDAIQMTREAQALARDVIDLDQCVDATDWAIRKLDACETGMWACRVLEQDKRMETVP
jgi:hypothetical protein